MVVKVPLSVYEDIEWIRMSGMVNMSDEIEVEEACRRLGFDEAANWIQSNPESYHRLLIEGPDLLNLGKESQTKNKRKIKHKSKAGKSPYPSEDEAIRDTIRKMIKSNA